MIPWRIRDPRTLHLLSPSESESGSPAKPGLGAICAVGSQGRDYATLLEAMRQLPHIPLILVAGAKNLRGLDAPANVEVRQNIPLAEAEAIIRRSRFVVVPLRDAQTACGHVTIVYALFEERAVVATNSAALAEYVIPGRNGILVPPQDAGALARAIENLWNDPDEARRLGAAGRELALRSASNRRRSTTSSDSSGSSVRRASSKTGAEADRADALFNFGHRARVLVERLPRQLVAAAKAPGAVRIFLAEERPQKPRLARPPWQRCAATRHRLRPPSRP